MNIDDHILLWKAASIQVLDIRYTKMQRDEQLSSYRLPASGFLYTIKGKATILLDSKSYKIENFYIAHVGKGSCLHISAVEDIVEYYLILYKATLPLPHRKGLLAIWEREKPFQLQYVFQVSNALTLQQKVETMYQQWLKQDNLEHFHVKALFYQCVYEFLQQLSQQHVIVQQPILWSKSKFI